MTEYIRPFVIGSSFPVFIQFFANVMKIDDKIKNYSYEKYSILAPLYLGLMNVVSLYLAKQFDLDLRQRMLYIGIISGIMVCVIAKLTNSYNFTKREWICYFIRIITKHIFTYSTIVYLLESNI